MQKQKNQTQLLAILSELLKLYHKYLLYSLRPDLPSDRKSGLIQALRERTKILLQKYGYDHDGGQLDLDGEKGSQNSKLLGRFLNRLHQKVKGYIEQFTKDQIPFLLNCHEQVILRMNQSFNFGELICNLFGLNADQIVKKESSIRKNSHYSLMGEFGEKKTAMSFSGLGNQKARASAVFKNFSKKSNQIQQSIQLLSILKIDEKELRKKYFSLFQNSQCIQQYKVSFSKDNNNLANFLHSQIQDVPKEKSRKSSGNGQALSKRSLGNGIQIMVPIIQQTHVLFQEMMERNKFNQQFIRKYEIIYNKYKSREDEKEKKELDKQFQALQAQKTLQNQTIKFQVSSTQPKDSKCFPHHDSILKKEKIRSQIPRRFLKQENQESQGFNEQQQSLFQNKVHKVSLTPNKNSLPELKILSREEAKQKDNPNEFYQKKQKKSSLSSYNTLNNLINTKQSRKQKLIAVSRIPVTIKDSTQVHSKPKPKSHSSSTLKNYTNLQTSLNIPNPPQVAPQPCHTQTQTPREKLKIQYRHKLGRSKQMLHLLMAKTKNQHNSCHHNANVENFKKDIESMELYNADSVLYMSKIQIKQLLEESGEGKVYGNEVKNGNDGFNVGHNGIYGNYRGKKIPHYQEIQDKRSKIQAFYSKVRPAKLGSLRAHSSQDPQPTVLIACRSYQPLQ